MSPELDAILCADFPLLYADRHASMQETCMCWGFDCSDGWYDIIRRASAKLEDLIKQEHAKQTHCYHCSEPREAHPVPERETKWGPVSCDKFQLIPYKASQVKEKYGSLRMYMDYETEEMSAVIRLAEHDSAKTCEECGEPGEVRGKGWLMCRCDACWGKRDNG